MVGCEKHAVLFFAKTQIVVLIPYTPLVVIIS